MTEVPHGTRARYQAPHRCRCEQCTRANRDYMQWYRNGGSRKPPPECGTRSRYVTYRCRCSACTEANRTYQREWFQKNRNFTYYDYSYGGLLP